MKTRAFGNLSDGRTAGLYIISNRNGMEAHLTDYGAALVRLIVPDRYGKFRDVVLGYDDAEGYERGGSSFGGTVGRFANRISNAAFDLNGRRYILTANNGPNTLHGGRDFYVHRLWSPLIGFGKISSGDIASAYAVESMNDWSGSGTAAIDQEDSVTFVLDSPDGDQGFPGAIQIRVTYTITDNNELCIEYRAAFAEEEGMPLTGSGEEAEDQGRSISTPLNLTNHSYFNLNGHDSGTVLTHRVQIKAGSFTETDMRSIPTGTLLDVKWTPMDFRIAKPLGQDIGADYEPLKYGNGYDHNYVLNSEKAELREAASMYADDSGIKMTVLTDMPGLQLYTANGLDNEEGKDGAVYRKRSAACFETQFWPDAVNKENFPGGILREGERFTSLTVYRFSVVEEEQPRRSQ